MSRLIIKNLPKRISEDTFRSVFSEYGAVTDVKLVYKSNGKFRGFGFIGYKTEKEAEIAIKALNNSLLSNQKISIDFCKNLQQDETVLKRLKKKEKDLNIEKPPNVNDDDFLKLKKVSNIDDELSGDEDQRPPPLSIDNKYSEFTCTMRGFPSKVKEQEIIQFFYPTNPVEVKVNRVKRRIKGNVLVSFQNKNDFDIAMKLNGECLDGRDIKLTKYLLNNDSSEHQKVNKKKKMNYHELNVNDIDELADSGRLFIRNLPFIATEDDIEKLFVKYGPVVEVHIPIDSFTHKSIGIAFVTFMMPEHAIKAYQVLDGSVFMGRMLHILPAKGKPEHKIEPKNEEEKNSTYKKDKLNKQKKSSQHAYNWNTLFMGTDAVTGAISDKYNVSKMEFLNSDDSKSSSAVKLALGETQIVQETRQFLLDNGISLDAFSQPDAPRSKSIILVKNLPPGVLANEIREKFKLFGELGRVVLAPAGVTAVVEFPQPTHAKQAFVKLAYRKFHNKPLYLEWAPAATFDGSKSTEKMSTDAEVKEEAASEPMDNTKNEKEEDVLLSEEEDSNQEGCLLFVKNLNFDTEEKNMKNRFESCGELVSCTISKKLGPNNNMLSMGYGFVQYKQKKDATKALKDLQKSSLDGHQLELKLSTRTASQVMRQHNPRKKQKVKKQISSKILVRNVPFQANKREISDLFKTFGEIKSLRIPTKLTGSTEKGKHRGFAFVDFISKQDAKKAFNALCHSTHLYGRRLVLEWADTEDDNVETLRRKTAENFNSNAKKSRTLKDFEDDVIMKTYKSQDDE